MDLIITTTPGKLQLTRLQFALRSMYNLTNTGIDRVMVIGQASREVAEWAEGVGVDLKPLMGEPSEAECILQCSRYVHGDVFLHMPDNCMLLAPFTPVRCVTLQGTRVEEDKGAKDRHARTVRWLLENEKDVYNYEIGTPAVFDRRRLQELEKLMGNEALGRMNLRTLYFSYFPDMHFRTKDTWVDAWSHRDDPKDIIINVSDTALNHPRCQKFLEERLPKLPVGAEPKNAPPM